MSQDRILRNYREADRRRKQREREEHDRVIAENEDLVADNDKLRRRASSAEREYHRILSEAKVLPDEFTNAVVSQMVGRIIESEIYREALEPVVREFMKRVLLRINSHRMPMGVEVEFSNERHGERVPHITVTIPEMRLTQILNDAYLENIAGGRGPYVMEDHPVPVVRQLGVSARPPRPDESLNMRVEYL